MKAMRLLLVMEEGGCGGAEISFFALCAALAARCNVDVALSRGSLENPTVQRLCQAFESAGGTVHCCEMHLNPGTIGNLHRALRTGAARELAALAGRLSPTALIVNLPTIERGQAVLDAAELCRPKLRVWGFLHLSQPPSIIGARLGLVRDFLVPRLLRRFDRLLSVSEDGAEEISRRYHLPRPFVLRPPTDLLVPLSPAAPRAVLRKARGLPDTFLLGVVGRLDLHHKAQDVALRVTQQLTLQGSGVHLVVVGDGPDRHALERLAQQLGLTSATTFLGWRDDVDQLIPLLDVLLIPSRYEGFPQAAVQAATAHVPVIGYAVGGLPELLPTDFLPLSGDEDGMLAAVTGLMRGSLKWPATEIAWRAADWCNPAKAADQLVTLLAADLAVPDS